MNQKQLKKHQENLIMQLHDCIRLEDNLRSEIARITEVLKSPKLTRLSKIEIQKEIQEKIS